MNKKIKSLLTALCIAVGLCATAFSAYAYGGKVYGPFTVECGDTQTVCLWDFIPTGWTDDNSPYRTYYTGMKIAAGPTSSFNYYSSPAQTIGLSVSKSNVAYTENYGGGDRMYSKYLVLSGTAIANNPSPIYNQVCSNSSAYFAICNMWDGFSDYSSQDAKDELEMCIARDAEIYTESAIVMRNIQKSKANGKTVAFGHKVQQGEEDYGCSEALQYSLSVYDKGAFKIFPDKYPDVVFLTNADWLSLCPWFNSYIRYNEAEYPDAFSLYSPRNIRRYNRDTRQYEDLYYAISYATYARYANTFMKKDYVNNLYHNLARTDEDLMKYDIADISSSSTQSTRIYVDGKRDYYTVANINYVSNYSAVQTVTFEDNIDTRITNNAVREQNYMEYWPSPNSTRESKKYYYESYLTDTEYCVSDYYLYTDSIKDNQAKWIPLKLGTQSQSLQFNKINFKIQIDGDVYNVKQLLLENGLNPEVKIFYVRRRGSATSVFAPYKNVWSPPVKFRCPKSVDKVVFKYTGPGVTQLLNINGTKGPNCPADCKGHENALKDIVATISYSDGSVKTLKYDQLKNCSEIKASFIQVVGDNPVQFRYTDDETGETWPTNGGYDTFIIKGLDPVVTAMDVSYVGPAITAIQETDESKDIYKVAADTCSFSPSNVSFKLLFNNHTSYILRGDSAGIGIYNPTEYSKTYKFSGTFPDFYTKQYNNVILGDITNDAVLNATDQKKYTEYIKGTTTLTATEKALADINKDGKVDNTDYESLKKRISKVITENDLKSSLKGKAFYGAYNKFKDSAAGHPQIKKFVVPATSRLLSSIYVLSPPNKTSYIEGDDFDPTGLMIRIVYNNGEYRDVSYPTTAANAPVLGNKSISLKDMPADLEFIPASYTENGITKTVNINIHVTTRKLTSIKITQAPSRTVYYAGENFDTTGMIVTAYFDEGVEEKNGHKLYTTVLDDNEYKLKNDKKLPDSRDFAIIKADDPTQTSSNMDEYEYVNKLTADATPDLEIGTHTTLKRKGKTNLTGLVVGNNYVRIAYTLGDVTRYAYQPITVDGKGVTSLSVYQLPFKTSYVEGDNFDPTGLLLKATYTDGTSEYVYRKSDTVDGYEITDAQNLTADRTSVTASYKGKTTKVNIEVIPPNIQSLEAVYTGTNVPVRGSIKRKDVTIIITYKNGDVTSFKANEINPDTSYKVRIQASNEDGTYDASAGDDLKVYYKGVNYFVAAYGGKTALFEVTGYEDPEMIDFSDSVASTIRTNKTWEETFTATKVKTVADYINGSIAANIDEKTTGLGTSYDSEENHMVEAMTTTDADRSDLSFETGTAKAATATTEYKSPLLNFLRQGELIQPETIISIAYRAKTSGFLFPETTNSKFAIDRDDDWRSTKYIQHYGQNQQSVINSDDGWSDWVNNGDSTGTVIGNRRAYNYKASNYEDLGDYTMHLDSLAFKLTNVPEGSNPSITIRYTDVNGSGGTVTATKDSSNMIIRNPATISMQLSGTVKVKQPDGSYATKNFGEVYKIYYRASVSDVTQWCSSGQTAGISGQKMQTFEAKLVPIDQLFDVGSQTNVPVITENPMSTTVHIGQVATFKVVVAGNANLAYQWYKNGSPITGATGTSYTTERLSSLEDGDEYKCVVKNTISGKTASTTTATLNVKEMIPIIESYTVTVGGKTTDAIDGVDAMVGTKIKAAVSARCYEGNMTYTWEMQNENKEWEGMANNSSDKSTIEFTLTKEMHGRKVRCSVKNTAGTAHTSEMILNSRQKPEVTLNIGVSTKTGNNFYTGSNVTSVMCTASTQVAAYPGIISYQWYVDDKLIESQDDPEGFSMGQCKIDVAGKLSKGKHVVKCIAKDKYDQTTVSVNLYVGEAPKVSITSQTITQGQSYKYIANITSNDDAANVSKQWYYNNQLLTSATTTIGGVTIKVVDANTITVSGLKTGTKAVVLCQATDNFGVGTGKYILDIK